MVMSPYFQDFGSEVVKEFGKDVYKKIKDQFKSEAELKSAELITQRPLSDDAKSLLKSHLETQLIKDQQFYIQIADIFKTTISDTLVLSLTLKAICEINDELPRLYSAWLKAGIEKKGTYQNRIEELEEQLRTLEEKFFLIIQRIPRA